jgi:hypothetical protein
MSTWGDAYRFNLFGADELTKKYGLVYKNKIVARFDSKAKAYQEGVRRYGGRIFEVVRFETFDTLDPVGGVSTSESSMPYLPHKLAHNPDHGEYAPPPRHYRTPGP